MSENLTQNVDAQYAKHREQIDMLEKSPLAKARPVSEHDVMALSGMLDQMEESLQFMSEAGTVSDLGGVNELG